MLDNSFGRFTLGFKMLRAFLDAIVDSIVRPNLPHLAFFVLVALTAFLPSAYGDGARTANEPIESQIHLALGPLVSGIRVREGWDSQVGGELHVVRISPSSRLATIGAALGATTYAKSDAIRLSLESYAGVTLSTDWTLGLSLAPVIDLFPTPRPLVGVGASLWLHAGVAPYFAVSRVWGLGASDHLDISVGLRIPFSVARF